MKLRRRICVLLLALLICCIQHALSSPLKEPNVCGQPLCEPGKKFNYTSGIRYSHRYSVDVTTLFRGTSQNKSTLHTSAQVHITFLTPCQGLLQITDVTLASERPQYNKEDDEDIISPPLPKADDFSLAISRKPLRFSWHDGAISELCPDPSDPVWVLNFKRGVLSAFHNTMQRFDIDSSEVETDVNGDCLTNYQLQEARSTALVIHKEKVVPTCRNRYKYRALVQTDPYDFGSSYQAIPLVKSRHLCEFSIDRRIYNTIECEEVHTFQPFSQAENGSQTITRQRIQFLQEVFTNASLPDEPLLKRVNLLFDHNATDKPISGELKTTRDLVRELCALNNDYNKEIGYPDAFRKLVQVGRRLNLGALTQIYQRSSQLCSSGHKQMVDVLPNLGTNAAVAVMVENMDKVSKDTAQSWLVSMAFIRTPNEETLRTFLKLLNSSDNQVLLSLTALGHTFCKNNHNCIESEPIQQIIHHLNEKLNGCQERLLTIEARDEILISLKAAGNLGVSIPPLISALRHCVLSDARDMELRTAAVTAHRRLPCEPVREMFLDIYRNGSFESELRIASYLQVLRCPNYHTISLIRQQLDHEEVNQVGSFVWSHLQNQLTSSMPTKVLVQTLLTDRLLNDKFNKDHRKFSRSYETSMFFDEFNAGGNVESHLIFSPKSYLPRTIMANVTLDLFGESVNVVEVEARAEGLEHLIEAVFGPGGPISATKVNSQVDRVLRLFRSVTGDNIMAEELNEIPNVIDNNFKVPKVSVGYKIFGNELFYSSVSGHQEFWNVIDKFNPAKRLKQLLSGQEIVVDKASMFMDADYIVPTGVGMPVVLLLQGTSAMNFNVVGNVRNLDPLALDIDGKLKPSVAVELTGEMGVDAYHATTGVKLKASVYTSTAVEGHVLVEGKSKATVSFNLPKEKGELITAQTKLIVIKGDIEEEQSGITEQRVSTHMCTWPSLNHTFGLKACMDAAFPNATHYTADSYPLLFLLKPPEGNLTDLTPSFLLSGPSHLAIGVSKADPTAERYVLQYRWDQKENITAISVVFDTPGSQQHRELSARLLLDNISKNLTLLLQSVDNKFEAHGSYRYEPNDKYFGFTLDINGKTQVLTQIGLRRTPTKRGWLYQPKLLIAINSERLVELMGSVTSTEKKDILQYDIKLDFLTKNLTLNMSGNMQRGQASWYTKMTFDYRFKDRQRERLMVELRVGNTSSKSLTQYNGELTVQSTAYSYLNFKSSLKYQRAQGHAEAKLVVNTRPDLKDERYKFTAHFSLSIHKSYDRSSLNVFISATKPISNIDLRLGVNFNGLQEKSTTYLTIRYATGKEVIVSLVLSMPRSDLLKFDGKLNVTLPGFVPMIFGVKLDEKKIGEYDIWLEGVWFSGHNMTAAGVYVDKSEGLLKSYSLKMFAQSPSFEDITVIAKYVSDVDKFKIDLQAEHVEEKYALVVKQATYGDGEMEAYGEVRYKSSLYTINTLINLNVAQQVVIELHLDKYRDVHIILSRENEQRLKVMGMEVKWDANRDPGQRFASQVRFQHPRTLVYSVDASAVYPGRKVVGLAEFSVLGTKFDSGLRLEWSPTDVLDVRAGATYTTGNLTDLRFTSQLLTPFVGWKRTSLSSCLYSKDNFVQVNGTVWWQDDQMVGANLFWDYDVPESIDTAVLRAELDDVDDVALEKLLHIYFPDFWCAFNASLLSTVNEVRPMHAAFSHKQLRNSMDTHINWRGKESSPVYVRSRWQVDGTDSSTQVVGNITLTTPYKGYNQGLLLGRLFYTSNLDIDGLAELNLDRKEYFATIKGYVKSLRNNMLIFNVTTPIPHMSAITGRLGYLEADHHLVCMWTMPNSSLGVEILLNYIESTNFNVLFHVATPLDFFSKLLLLGKRQQHLLELRAAFNQILLGVIGSWRYVGLTDFNYEYTLYTPLQGFNETTLVAKILVKDGIDVDMRMQVVGVKVGTTILWVKKSTGLRRTFVKIQPVGSEEHSEKDKEMRWRGSCKIDTHIYRTITCDVSLDRLHHNTVIEANAALPSGNVYMYDEFYFKDAFNIKNDLQLSTPFSSCPEISSVAHFHLIPSTDVLLELEVHVRAENITKKGGFLLRYKRDGPSDEDYYDDEATEGVPIQHAGTLQCHTPWPALPLLRITTLVTIADMSATSNLTIVTNQTWFTVEAATVSDKEYKKVRIRSMLISPEYLLPEVTIEAKQDTNDAGTVFEILAKCPELARSYSANGKYRYIPQEELNVECVIETTSYKDFLFVFDVSNKSEVLSLHSKIHHHPEILVEINGRKHGSVISLSAERSNMAALVFDGSLSGLESGGHNLLGVLLLKNHNTKDKWDIMEYKVDTVINVDPSKNFTLQLTLEPQKEGDRSVFIEAWSSRNEKEVKLDTSLKVGRDALTLSAGIEFDANEINSIKTDLRSSLSVLKDVHTNVALVKNADSSWDFGFDATTPNYGTRKILAKGYYWMDKFSKKLSGAVITDSATWQMRCEYSWLALENMAGLFSGSYKPAGNDENHVHAEIFYRHPGQNLKLISTGLDFDIDRFYRFGTNATLSMPTEGDIAINMHLKLPQPGDIHSIAGKMRYTPGNSYVAHTVQYSSLEGLAIVGSSGEVSTNINNTEVGGNIKLEWGTLPNVAAITNMLLYKKPNTSHIDVQYTLHTPYYPDDTVVARFTGHCPDNVWDLKAHLHHPRSNPLTSANFSYQAINNVNGTVQTKTPFAKIPQVAVDFEIVSHNSGHFRRHLTLNWPNNSAIVKSDYWDVYSITSNSRVRDLNGQIFVEIPLASRLFANATYLYKDAYPKSSGEATINYNGSKIVGHYGCVSEARAGYSKDDMDISLDNKLIFPVGAHYIHEVHYDGQTDDNGVLLSRDRKWIDLFRLGNRTAFNVEGELQVRNLEDGKVIKVSAVQANTTVNLDTDYHYLDHRFTHSSKLTLPPTAWVSYYLDIVNKTTDTQEEGDIRLDIAYPQKNFTLSGHVRQDSIAHESDIKLEWNRPENPRTLGAGFDWWRASQKPDQQVATLRLKHPSFVKDVTLNSTYIRHGTKSILGRIELEYSNITNKKLLIEGSAKDLSISSQSLYAMEVLATHPATRLDLAARGTISVRPGEYEGKGDARYKRSFLGQQNGHVVARLDGINKSINLEKRLQHEESYFRARVINDDACCMRVNGSLAKTQSLNYSGDFFIDLDEKLLLTTVNMTEDGRENLQAHGYIPDARFAELNVWRTYDDLTVTDIACYLKLNHSRLLTSRLKWRPTLRQETFQLIEDAYLAVLKNVDDTVDYWKDYIRSEVKEAVADIYYNSKSDVQQFIDDLEDLKSLEQDFDDLRLFLNETYNRNAFYVKDISSTLLLLVDELALKKHIGNVPVVLGELWRALGESGESIRRSLAWIIETVKTSYRKAVELIHQLLNGDSGAKISSLLEDWIVRYDRTVKELQMTVLRHIEQLYTSITDSMSDTWSNLLRSIEPTYIQIVHYLEGAVYGISHEILDFLYERESELRESPFFIRIANFTQDLDRFHKDLLERDIFTNINDYSTRFYVIVRDRYLPKIPFGKEIHRVVAEIVEGFQELEKLPSINYLAKKRDEAIQRLVWFWQSLDLGTKLQKIATIVQRRLLDVTASALQSENRYREAKTKFIFEPMQGLVLLEQKLPMSWHALNETPRFEEIPEYRAVVVLQNQLTFSNKTFWAFYYEYKPYTEIQNWLPPFKGQAMVAGSQHLVTFDGRFLSFKGDCDYLLARDFVNGNFSLVMRHGTNHTKQEQFLLSLITPLHTITIDIFNDEIYLPPGQSLPAQLGPVQVYKEHGVVTIEERDGYILQCNVLFQVCTISLSGWYYGKTAGLLGTMDHEITSDLLTSHGHITADVAVFARSWVVNRKQCAGFANKATIPSEPAEDVLSACNSLFHSKSSDFSPCFGLVNPAPYLRMCLAKPQEKCSAAAAYVLACHTQYTLLTIPESCVTCSTMDGKMYTEGAFIKLSGELVPRSVDVVFIVEAKACNQNMTSQRNIGIFLNVLAKKLDDVGLKNNRYATVVFGGDGVFDSPRALLPDHPAASTETFTSITHALKAFQKFQIGNGSEDIFEAIAYASTLQFRPGVSKIFVALPCSSCDPSGLTMEYSVLRQVMLENNIRLHLLMKDDFQFKKKRLSNLFYGIDNVFAYTKKDRDMDLRHQILLPKSMVAYCAPLALETNGTVFTAKWLMGEKTHPVNKFAGVLSKRIAATAEPASCQHCECSSFETGMGFMNCQPCDQPAATNPQLGHDDYTDGDEGPGEADDYSDVVENSSR